MPFPALILLLACCFAVMAQAVAAPSARFSRSPSAEVCAFRFADAGNSTSVLQAGAKSKAVEMRRVIVTLRLEGSAPTDEVAIAAVQDRIISSVTKLGATVERKFPNLPQLVLTVTPQALAELRKSSDVISVHDDRPQPPTR